MATACEFITRSNQCAHGMGNGNEEENRRQRGLIASNLKAVVPELEFLELRLTKMYVQRVLPTVQSWTAREVLDHLAIIDERMKDELAMFSLIFLSPKEREYYQRSDLLGAPFKAAFPAANDEITEAGTCFALGRYTASVFHLVRATEIGLEAIHAALGLPGIEKKPWTWDDALKDIDEVIKDNDRALIADPGWVENAAFFRKAYALLWAIKGPFRNETTHVELTFGENEAERVFDAVKAFLAHLATRLGE